MIAKTSSAIGSLAMPRTLPAEHPLPGRSGDTPNSMGTQFYRLESADQFCWYAAVKAVRLAVTAHDRTGSDHGASTNGDACEDGGTGPDPGTVLYRDGLHASSACPALRIRHVVGASDEPNTDCDADGPSDRHGRAVVDDRAGI